MGTDTQEQLLDAAEALVMENGFAATSLRSIASAAKVNLAATHYHFGSKRGLLEAMIHRRVTPINEARLRKLDDLETRDVEPTISEICQAFLEPLMALDESVDLPGFIGRVYSEPPATAKALLEREFGEVAARFTGALGKALPELPIEEVRWRFHFLVGGMLQTLSLAAPIGSTCETPRQDKFEQLIQFAKAGFLAPTLSAVDSEQNSEEVEQ